MEYSKFEVTAIESLKKLLKRLGDSKLTSKHWNKNKHNIFETIVTAMRFDFNLFFTTSVRIHPKNSSKHVFYVSTSQFE